MDKASFLDLVLLPKSYYTRITDKRLTLYLGIFFIGVIDVILFSVYNYYKEYFTSQVPSVFFYNLTIIVFLAVIIGFVDVLLFSLPLFDLCKILTKNNPIFLDGSFLIKIMKVYISTHFVILPIELIIMLLLHLNISIQSSGLLLIALLLNFLLPLWVCGIVARGLNTIFGFKGIYKNIMFISVFLWNFFLSTALTYGISHLIELALKKR